MTNNKKNLLKVGEHYDRVQKFYDLFWMNKKNLGMHYGFWDKNTKNLHEAILNENRFVAEQLKIKKSDIVLDAGCGIGGTAIWLAENYGVRVIGITIAQKQLGLATKYVQKRRVNHLVEFRLMDFCQTDFPNNFFTKIFAIESVCHTEKKEEFIEESFRILKPGGLLVVADFFRKENLNEQERYLLDQWCYGWEMPNISILAEFSRELNLAGFKNIRCFDKTKEIAPSSKRMYVVIGRVMRIILKCLELIKIRSSHGGTKATQSQYHLFKKQTTTYNVFVAEKPL